jgi:RNA-directed DNA polymerase
MRKERTKEQTTKWTEEEYRSQIRIVRKIQNRIFNAQSQYDIKRIQNLQKLIIHSYANRYVSIYRITKINPGKITAGTDQEIVITDEQRDQCLSWLERINFINYQPPPILRRYIPKRNGKLRPLGIPTIRDRIVQCLISNSLEPQWEALFNYRSCGFRPNKGCHDAITLIQQKIKRCQNKNWCYAIWDADIKGFFDNVSHQAILKRLELTPFYKNIIQKWLTTTIIENGVKLIPRQIGTPQGGVISPLLANIALHGLECLGIIENTGIETIRYADDLLTIAPSRKSLEWWIYTKVQPFLKSRGLEINAEKTRILHGNTKFRISFLGFDLIKRYTSSKAQILLKPNREKLRSHYHELKKIIEQNLQATQYELIRKLSPIIRGFAEYYKVCHCSREMNAQDHLLWWKLWRWCLRRHPNKSKRWIMQKYWTIDPQHKWYFKESEGKELYWHSTRKYEQHLIRTRNPYIDFE